VSEPARRVICAAATVGRELTVDTLPAICELTHKLAFEALEEGLAARLLVEDYHQVDRYLFAHAVVRNAVYATIRRSSASISTAESPRSSKRKRSTVGDRVDPARAEIAHHYVEAAPLGLQHKAAVHAERAADDAARRFAFGEAAVGTSTRSGSDRTRTTRRRRAGSSSRSGEPWRMTSRSSRTRRAARRRPRARGGATTPRSWPTWRW
jgi:hypothetical protein